MISLSLNGPPTETRQVLCLGCHSDDIEIGCGGTILRLAMEHPDWVFHWVVFGAIGPRAAEAREAAARFLDPSRLRGPVLHSRFHAVRRCRNQSGVRGIEEDCLAGSHLLA
jgi:LmbE family N-acetylglucosaminyl deacetylase